MYAGLLTLHVHVSVYLFNRFECVLYLFTILARDAHSSDNDRISYQRLSAVRGTVL